MECQRPGSQSGKREHHKACYPLKEVGRGEVGAQSHWKNFGGQCRTQPSGVSRFISAGLRDACKEQ